MLIRRSIVIERPAEEVFEFIVDSDNDPKWCPTVLESQLVEGSPGQVGTRYRQVQKPGPTEQELDVRIDRVSPPHEVELHSTTDVAESDVTYLLEETASGTRLAQTTNMSFKGFGYLLYPILRFVMPSTVEDQLENLKETLESPPD